MSKLQKPDLIDAVYTEVEGITRNQAKLAVETFLGEIQRNLAVGTPVNITGFGKFETKSRPERVRRVFKEEHVIPAATLVKFKPGKNLRDAVDR